MSRSPSIKSLALCLFFVLQIIAPMVHSEESSSPNRAVNYSQHLESLENVGIYPSGELINGWFDDKNSVGEITLLYRTASVIPLAKFADWAQKETLDGRYIITHQLPVPTEWRHDLSDNGITCDSFMPPNGFSCRFTGVTLDQLADLSVLGIVKLDTVDKIRFGLAESLLDKRVVTLDVVLSGYELPSEINARDDIKVLDHSSRFATLDASLSGLKWLVLQDEIEWIEEKPVAGIVNSVANTIINSDDVRDNTKMAALSGAWSGLDGSGITVTVGDTGLDSGINDATMHPDFSDHILGIYSWPEPYSECTWNSPSDPGPCDDGADDDNGHGTHVAGSVLGDGTASSGSVMGIAPEAQLLVHAFEQNGGLGGIPNDYQDFFDVAVENNSRIHTNSWGSCNRPNKHAPCNDYGLYSTGSMQIDMGALTHKQLVILFANGNDAEDGDGNGEIDENSMLWEATAKNSISIGASENYRPSRGPAADNAEGMASFSGRGPTEDGRIKPDFVAPGTHIYSTKSRAAGPAASSCGWGSDSSITDYCFMGGTSMATPIAAGATALLLEHLIENEGVADPTSYLVKAILGASTTDMAGQFGSPTNGAGEAIPNMHEGNGRLNMYSAVQTSFVHNESLSTTDDRGWSFTLPHGAHDLQVALAYADPAATPAVTPYLVNDLDLSLTDPTGTVHDLNDNLNNLRVMNISSPRAITPTATCTTFIT
ncbi:MAG: S8 family serine peptidase [Candidatus Thermoplasmatota archaeon]|nr:S8 family serine peptidase [Candidatus Thermoplasmatota archaeon]